MRNRLWIQFHIGAIVVLALLTTANVATWLRPFASTADGSPENSARTLTSINISNANRSPATISGTSPENSKNPMKIVQVGCEPNMRLRVFETVRQIRLQFDACNEEVTGALNSTNGFQATIFGTAKARTAQAETERAIAFEPAAGTFTPALKNSTKIAKRGLATEQKKPVLQQTNSTPISTDYISLETGTNQIKIVRVGREQFLSIERK